MDQLRKLVSTIKEVRQERIENRKKRRQRDRNGEKEDAVVQRFLQHPDLWDEKDEKVGLKVFEKIKKIAKDIFTGNVDWAAAKKWLQENWVKVVQIILSVIGLAIAVGT